MKSKIINMGERLKDADDRMLETLFRADPIADDGFSERIVRKIRRRLWLRRLAVPFAAAIGAAVALEPLVTLAAMLIDVVAALPNEVVLASTGWIPPLPTIVLGGLLFAALMFVLRMFEE